MIDMENNLSVFKFDGMDIRVFEIGNNPWWVGKDVAEILGYSNTKDAMSKHVDEDDRKVIKPVDFPKRSQNATYEIPPRGLTIINESGLYSLIIGSKLPTAKKFKRWITSEVLPSIRKHGGYIAGQENHEMTDAELLAKALTVANNVMEQRAQRIAALEAENNLLDEQNKTLLIANEAANATIAQMKPKVDYYDLVMSSKNTLTTTQVAADFGLSAVRMNQMLNAWKIQYKINNQWILYQQYKDKGYVRSVAKPIKTNGGYRFCAESTQWTQAGRLFLYELMKKNGILPVCERVNNDDEF
jgi:prophage antirepressor-like protein